MKFVWDDEKNRLNYKKHGVWFEESVSLWENYLSIEFYDPDHSLIEDRFIRVGFSNRGKLLIVVFCDSFCEVIRIISSRQATKKEREQYEKGI